MSRFAAPGVRRVLPAVALGFACSAQAGPTDPLEVLQRAVQASRQATYEGTYVHTNGDRTSTVRVSHLKQISAEYERIEPLDGANPLELVRRNDEMYCKFPAKTVRLDTRITNRFFPAIMVSGATTIAASYDVKLGRTEQVLGFECRWIRLDARDNLRFSQRLCSEAETGLILRAKVMNERKQVIEQYTFTELKIGPLVPHTELKTAFKARARQWLSDGQPRDDTASVESGWAVRLPPGFQTLAELKRTLPGRSEPVAQIVLTDGAASMSIFVEPNSEPRKTAEMFSEDGTTSYFALPIGEKLISVLGEVPLATAQQVARSVSRR